MSPFSQEIIWATRGRFWGFRFLLDAGLSDPLRDYERAFGDLRDAPTAFLRDGPRVALRIQDPLGRRDAAGRTIPHEFVIFGALAGSVESVEDGVTSIWPLVAGFYAAVWDDPNSPTSESHKFGSA